MRSDTVWLVTVDGHVAYVCGSIESTRTKCLDVLWRYRSAADVAGRARNQLDRLWLGRDLDTEIFTIRIREVV